MDCLIENARLIGQETLCQIGIDEGRISFVGEKASEESESKIDAKGNLVLPTFIEPHIHLDKVLLSEKLKEANSISEARQMVREAKRGFSVDEIKDRASRVIPWALQNGVTIIRTHLDVDSSVKTRSIEAILQLEKKYRNVLDLQIVAFPQEGIIKDSEVPELLRSAVDLGATVLGGLPESELSEDNARKHIDFLFVLAKQMDVDIDIHCDVIPGFKNIEYFASSVLKNNYQNRSTADHLIALSYYDEEYASRIITRIKEASINVISNPCTMMSSGSSPRVPQARGITLVRDLVRAGVNVSFGSDNVIDPYNPLGDLNPLSNGFLLAYGAQMSSLSELETIIKMPTYFAAKTLRLRDYGLNVGDNADINIFSDSTPREILRKHGKPVLVIKRGKIIVQNKLETEYRF